GNLFLDGHIDGTADLFADHTSHGAPYEGKVHTGDHDVPTLGFANGGPDGILKPRFLLGGLQAFRVFLGVDEFEGVLGLEVGIQLLELVVVEQDLKIFLAPDLDVIAVLGADVKVFG